MADSPANTPTDPIWGTLFKFPPELRAIISDEMVSATQFTVFFGGDGYELILSNDTSEVGGLNHGLQQYAFDRKRAMVPLAIVRYHGPDDMTLKGLCPILPTTPQQLMVLYTMGTTSAVSEFHITVTSTEYDVEEHAREYSWLVPLSMVGPFFDLLATRQVKAEAIQPDQTGAKYSVIAHILNYRQLPAHLRLRVTNRMNALLARIDHSSTGLQWLVLGPGGRLIRRDVQHNLTRVAWAQNQRDSVVRYMRTINARYAYDAGAMLSGTKERFRMAPYTRLSMDAVRLALAVRPYTSEDAIMDDCYTASARVACYAAFSCDIIDYKEAGVDYANWFDDGGDCALERCFCHALHALGLDVASSVVPALFVGYEWFWHACRWLACMRHGLEAQADPDLDLMIQELQTIGKLLHKLAKDTTNPDKQLAELVWKSVKADGLALVAEESNPSPKDPEQEFDYGFGICNKLSPHFTPFLVSGAGIRATPYIDVIKNNADWMDMAHFQNEEV